MDSLHVPVSADLLASIGQPPAWSEAVRAGNHVYVTGQVGWDKRTGTMREGIETQTRQALENLRDVLEQAGSSLADVVIVRVYLTDAADHDQYTAVYQDFFPEKPPARVTVVVHDLVDEGSLIDVEAEAIAGLASRY